MMIQRPFAEPGLGHFSAQWGMPAPRLPLRVARTAARFADALLAIRLLPTALLMLALAGTAQAQLSGNGDEVFIVGVSALRGEPGKNFGGAGIKTGDLNCDGRDEIIVLQPQASVGGTLTAGTLTVIPSTATSRPDPTLSFEWNQGTSGVLNSPEVGDRYGESADVFDFDKDGCDDLFVGVPGEDLSNISDAGAVHAFRGNASSTLTTTGSSFLVDGSQAAGDEFGHSFAAMSFGASTSTHRLFVAAPFANTLVNITNTGRISKFKSAPGCLVCVVEPTFQMSSFANNVQNNDRYGVQMQAFGLGIARRFMAIRGQGANALSIAREVNTGPTSRRTFRRSSFTPAITNAGAFAEVFVAGDFDGGLDDVAMLSEFSSGSIPFEIFVVEQSGQDFVQRQRIVGPLVNTTLTSEFLFVTAMATGDFDADGFGDLAIGFTGIAEFDGNFGNVLILRGSQNGLITTNPQRLRRGFDGINGSGALDEAFGSSLAVGDFNGDGVDDLVVGVPGQRFQGQLRGGVHLIYGAQTPFIFRNGFE